MLEDTDEPLGGQARNNRLLIQIEPYCQTSDKIVPSVFLKYSRIVFVSLEVINPRGFAFHLSGKGSN